jgi:hypothetical protein
MIISSTITGHSDSADKAILLVLDAGMESEEGILCAL